MPWRRPYSPHNRSTSLSIHDLQALPRAGRLVFIHPLVVSRLGEGHTMSPDNGLCAPLLVHRASLSIPRDATATQRPSLKLASCSLPAGSLRLGWPLPASRWLLLAQKVRGIRMEGLGGRRDEGSDRTEMGPRALPVVMHCGQEGENLCVDFC